MAVAVARATAMVAELRSARRLRFILPITPFSVVVLAAMMSRARGSLVRLLRLSSILSPRAPALRALPRTGGRARLVGAYDRERQVGLV
jgi:hypothetical protein